MRKPQMMAAVLVLAMLLCVIMAGCDDPQPSATNQSTTQPSAYLPITDRLQVQIKQDFIAQFTDPNVSYSVNMVELTIVSYLGDRFALFVDIPPHIFYDQTMCLVTVNDLQFWYRTSQTMYLYYEGRFYTFQNALDEKVITEAQLATVWEDYYAQYPAMKAYWEKANSDSEPNEQERVMLEQYRAIVKFLGENDLANRQNKHVVEYDANGMILKEYCGSDGVKFCYRKLQEMTEIDGWMDYLKDYYGEHYEWDRQEHLNRFTWIKDVPRYQSLYQGDEIMFSTTQRSVWHYDSQGRVLYEILDYGLNFSMLEIIPGNDHPVHYRYFYDENGRVSRIEDYNLVYIPYYDESGRLNSMSVLYDIYVNYIQYTYDEAGRLILVDEQAGKKNLEMSTIEYTYDENGNLIRKQKSTYNVKDRDGAPELSMRYITEYTYDENNVLVSGSYAKQAWNRMYEEREFYTFTYDAQGRLIGADIVYDGTRYMTGEKAGERVGEPAYARGYVEYTYGDYLVYTKP